MSQVAGRERKKYLERTVSRVVPSWDQNYTSWVSPSQSSLMWARYPACKTRALRDAESLEVGLKASRKVTMFCPGCSQNLKGHL